MPGESGLLMCSWPRGDQQRVTKGIDSYFNECMNGFEHQVAGHMIWEGMVQEGLAVERAIHDRYAAANAIRGTRWNAAITSAVDGELRRFYRGVRV